MSTLWKDYWGDATVKPPGDAIGGEFKNIIAAFCDPPVFGCIMSEEEEFMGRLKCLARESGCGKTMKPTRVLISTNPGGPGHGWLRSRFLKNAINPGESLSSALQRIDRETCDAGDYSCKLQQAMSKRNISPVGNGKMPDYFEEYLKRSTNAVKNI